VGSLSIFDDQPAVRLAFCAASLRFIGWQLGTHWSDGGLSSLMRDCRLRAPTTVGATLWGRDFVWPDTTSFRTPQQGNLIGARNPAAYVGRSIPSGMASPSRGKFAGIHDARAGAI
jgi:hypothetical protein